jgi:hypothetical protein
MARRRRPSLVFGLNTHNNKISHINSIVRSTSVTIVNNSTRVITIESIGYEHQVNSFGELVKELTIRSNNSLTKFYDILPN